MEGTNVRSLLAALDRLGLEYVCTDERCREAASASHVIIPGVSTFSVITRSITCSSAYELLCHKVIDSHTPVLGICAGMQVMLTESEECPGVQGLDWLPGHVVGLPEGTFGKSVNTGWSGLRVANDRSKNSAMWSVIEQNDFYFNHSFCCSLDSPGIGTGFIDVNCESTILGVFNKENFWGVQFHPEISGRAGIQLLKLFCESV